MGHALADGVEHGIAYGCNRRDSRRLADADDAALRHVKHVDGNPGHIGDGAELVELHVWIALPTGACVHDALLEQGAVDAHDDGPGHLRFAAKLVDKEAAILDGHEVDAADHARFGVHFDFSDLDATH